MTGQSIKINVQDGRIQAIAPGFPDEKAWLSPGFIDLQVNGYLGSDLNSGVTDPEVVIALTRKMISTGVTTYLPTVITASEEKITTSLRTIAEARRIDPMVAHAIPFAHVEGPFISPEDGPLGAHPREHVRPASVDEFERWQSACGNLVGLVTLSPHREDTLKFISTLSGNGVLVAIGHSDASPSQIHAAVDAGATLSTHLGNGLGSPLPRHPNLVWAQLADDRLTACFIADGTHLPADTLKAMLRAKSIDRSILVSDVIALGGMPAGIYEIGDDPPSEVTADGRIVNAYGPRFLMGAYRALIDGIANVAGMNGFSLGDAIRMATENPGRFVGGRGRLRVGADADLVRFHWEPSAANLKIETVLLNGEECS